MGPIRAEIEVDAPREAAYALISDLARRPTFTDHFLTGFHLTRLEARGEGAGARFRVKAPLRSPWEDTSIVALEEPFKIEEMPATGNFPENPDLKTRRIVINRRDTILELYEGEKLIASVPIAPGSPKHPTPPGKWKILGVSAAIGVAAIASTLAAGTFEIGASDPIARSDPVAMAASAIRGFGARFATTTLVGSWRRWLV